MKILGIILLLAGLAGIVYGLTMETGAKLESQDLGIVKTPEIQVHDKAREEKKRNILIASGVVLVVGAVLASQKR